MNVNVKDEEKKISFSKDFKAHCEILKRISKITWGGYTMKRLVKQTNKSMDECFKGNMGKDKVFVTKAVHDKDAAIEAKMRSVEPRILGIKMISYEQKGMRKVWVPCYFMVYDFKVKRNVFFNKAQVFDKEGRVGAVYDANEMHASHYDVLTDGEIAMEKKAISTLDGDILPDAGDLKKIIEDTEYSIRRQILFKAYRTMESELKQIKLLKFYREAYELEMAYKDRTFIKYAYLDDYGITNERARGLNTRLDSI